MICQIFMADKGRKTMKRPPYAGTVHRSFRLTEIANPGLLQSAWPVASVTHI